MLILHPETIIIMGRILAIDYGKKRVGLAVTDELQIIATGLDTVLTHEIIPYLKKYLNDNVVDCFVVGMPMRMHFEEPEIEKNIATFVNGLKNAFPKIPVERYDERFTSKMAFQTMIDSGLNKTDRKDKALVDKISATIILQSFMEFRENKHKQL
jgi:putative holliday junction resolvase